MELEEIYDYKSQWKHYEEDNKDRYFLDLKCIILKNIL